MVLRNLCPKKDPPPGRSASPAKHYTYVEVRALGRSAGHWGALADRYVVGTDALSYPARIVLQLALTYRSGHVPTTEGLYQAQKANAIKLGHPYFGKNRVKEALAELKSRGFYGVRRVSGGSGRILQLRSFSNTPFDHLTALSARDAADLLRQHFPERRERLAVGGECKADDGNVVDLFRPRLDRVG